MAFPGHPTQQQFGAMFNGRTASSRQDAVHPDGERYSEAGGSGSSSPLTPLSSSSEGDDGTIVNLEEEGNRDTPSPSSIEDCADDDDYPMGEECSDDDCEDDDSYSEGDEDSDDDCEDDGAYPVSGKDPNDDIDDDDYPLGEEDTGEILLPTFNGTGAVDVHTFLKCMQRWFRTFKVPRERWTDIAESYLRSEAAGWYEYLKRCNGRVTPEWTVFKTEILERYETQMDLELAMSDLFENTFDGDLAGYIGAFRLYEARIAHRLDFTDSVQLFLSALPTLRKRVLAKRPTTIEEVYQAALDSEQELAKEAENAEKRPARSAWPR